MDGMCTENKAFRGVHTNSVCVIQNAVYVRQKKSRMQYIIPSELPQDCYMILYTHIFVCVAQSHICAVFCAILLVNLSSLK